MFFRTLTEKSDSVLTNTNNKNFDQISANILYVWKNLENIIISAKKINNLTHNLKVRHYIIRMISILIHLENFYDKIQFYPTTCYQIEYIETWETGVREAVCGYEADQN